jgi:hypothetical protein
MRGLFGTCGFTSIEKLYSPRGRRPAKRDPKPDVVKALQHDPSKNVQELPAGDSEMLERRGP